MGHQKKRSPTTGLRTSTGTTTEVSPLGQSVSQKITSCLRKTQHHNRRTKDKHGGRQKQNKNNSSKLCVTNCHQAVNHTTVHPSTTGIIIIPFHLEGLTEARGKHVVCYSHQDHFTACR